MNRQKQPSAAKAAAGFDVSIGTAEAVPFQNQLLPMIHHPHTVAPKRNRAGAVDIFPRLLRGGTGKRAKKKREGVEPLPL